MGEHGPIQRGVGHVVTRLMMWKPVRRTRLGQRAYGRMYLAGKAYAERDEARFLGEHLQPGMTVVDAGANVGFYTVLFSRAVGTSGAVHAFEPDPFCASILRDRLRRLVPDENVLVEEAALGDTEGEAVLYCSHRDRAESRLHPFASAMPVEPVRVRTTTLDAYCRARGIGRIDAVKIDVEGAEVAVLRGMAEIMASRPPAWIFIEFSPEQLAGEGSTAEEFWSLLAEGGYNVRALRERGGLEQIANRAAFTRDHVHTHTNLWAVHPESRRLAVPTRG